MRAKTRRSDRDGDRDRELRDLARDTRGAALTEYVVLVGAVGLIVAFAVAAAGLNLIHRFEMARFILMLPIP